MNLRQRTVHYYEVVLRSWTRVESIKSPGCCDLRDLLARVDPRAVKDLKLGGHRQLTVELAEWKEDKQSGTFWGLINRADANVSDIALRDLNTRKVRKAGKLRHEGIESSAHVLIAPHSDGRRALILLTMGAGVSMLTLEKMFKEVGRTVLSDPANDDLSMFDHPSGERKKDGSPTQYRVHYSFDVLAHKGQILDDALRNGQFASMELVAHEHEKFDAGGNLQITQQSVHVKAANPAIVSAAALVKAVKSHLRGSPSYQYDKLKIQYKNDTGEPASATLKINELDAAFTKKVSIHFDTDVEQQQTSISMTVMTELLALRR